MSSFCCRRAPCWTCSWALRWLNRISAQLALHRAQSKSCSSVGSWEWRRHGLCARWGWMRRLQSSRQKAPQHHGVSHPRHLQTRTSRRCACKRSSWRDSAMFLPRGTANWRQRAATQTKCLSRCPERWRHPCRQFPMTCTLIAPPSTRMMTLRPWNKPASIWAKSRQWTLLRKLHQVDPLRHFFVLLHHLLISLSCNSSCVGSWLWHLHLLCRVSLGSTQDLRKQKQAITARCRQ